METIFLNIFTFSVFVLFVGALIYWELRWPWGFVIPIVGVTAVVTAFMFIENQPMAYVVAYGGIGILLFFAEWIKGRESAGGKRDNFHVVHHR